MATTKAAMNRSKRASAKPITDSGRGPAQGIGLSALINTGLTSSFDAIREKIASSIGSNGEEYLHEAVDKITESTAQVVTWCKRNPIKMVVGIAALTAVSSFLIHTMAVSGPTAPKRADKKSARSIKGIRTPRSANVA